MIKAWLGFWGPQAETVARSLEPDNLPDMKLILREDCFALEFSVEKIGTLLSTADDLLMNIKIAEETLLSGEDK